MRRAASRAACTAGKSSATSTPIIAITTSSSTRVKARRAGKCMAGTPAGGWVQQRESPDYRPARGSNSTKFQQKRPRDTLAAPDDSQSRLPAVSLVCHGLLVDRLDVSRGDNLGGLTD